MKNENNEIYNALPKLLTPDETLAYCMLAAAGDVISKQKLKEHNLRLIVEVVKSYFKDDFEKKTPTEMYNILNAAASGLIVAIDTFDVDSKLDFNRFASAKILNGILTHLKEVLEFENIKTNLEKKEDIQKL